MFHGKHAGKELASIFFFEEPGIDLLWMRKKIGVGGGGLSVALLFVLSQQNVDLCGKSGFKERKTMLPRREFVKA